MNGDDLARQRALEMMGGRALSLAPLAPVPLTQAMPAAEGVATYSVPVRQEPSFDEVAARARRAGFGIDLARAGAMANEAITGAAAPMHAYDDLAERSQAPVRMFDARQKAEYEAALRDPFSPESQRRRAALERANPELARSVGSGPAVAWSDIEAVHGMLPPAPRPGVAQLSSDPNSPESKLAQARVRAVLAGVLTDEELATVTAASESDVMKYGSLARRDEVIREGQVASGKQFTQRLGLDYAKMSQDERQFYDGLAEQVAAREAARAERKDDATQREVLKLSERLENMPGIAKDLSMLSTYAVAPDVPGVGATGVLPAKLLSDEGIRVRQAVRGVLGALLKEQSGLAVSEAEIDRKLEELGMGRTATDREFRIGLSRLLTNTNEVMRSKESGVSPEAVKRYRARGGTTSADLPSPNAPRVISVKGMKPGDLLKAIKEGETVRVPMGGGSFQTVRKQNGKLLKVRE